MLRRTNLCAYSGGLAYALARTTGKEYGFLTTHQDLGPYEFYITLRYAFYKITYVLNLAGSRSVIPIAALQTQA